MTIQAQIADLLLQQAILVDSPLKSLLTGKDTQQVCYMIFHSYRGNEKTARGLRLSDVGLNLLKAFFKCYNINMSPGYKIKMPHLIYLDRVCKMPYWISNEYLAIFDTELGMMLKMSDGNLDTLIEARFRLSQESTKIIKD